MQRTKELWTTGLDEAINFPVERFIRNGEAFLKQWCDFFGEDYNAQAHDRQNRIDDDLTLGVIDGAYPMRIIENFRYIEALKRLAMSGQIKRVKTGWRVKK